MKVNSRLMSLRAEEVGTWQTATATASGSDSGTRKDMPILLKYTLGCLKLDEVHRWH